MYQRIDYVKDIVNIKAPKEVADAIISIANGLDFKYVIFVETEEDLQLVCELEIDVELCTPEHTEFIKTPAGLYTSTIFLINNKLSTVIVIMPQEITPKNILDSM